MKIRLGFPSKVEVEVGQSADVKVQVSKVGPEPSYPDDTFWRHKDAKIDPRVFYIENQKRRHVEEKAWEPMSEEKGVTWADVKPLSEQDWRIFLDAIEEGKPIERWPEEEEEENHHTKEVYKIAYTTPFKSGMITDCANLGFNVINCGATCKMDPDAVWNFLEKCRAAGAKGNPRVDDGSHLPDVIRRIKDHPNLLAVNQHDEMEGSKISLDRQYAYYEAVKTIAPNLQVFCNWNGSSPGKSWDEFFPPKDKIHLVCDTVLFCVYPYGSIQSKYTPDEWMQSEKERAWKYLNPDTKIAPIIQGFYGGHQGWIYPDMKHQWDFWKQWCNSYAIWLYHPDSADTFGFEKGKLREQVKELNSQT